MMNHFKHAQYRNIYIYKRELDKYTKRAIMWALFNYVG